MAWRRGGCRRDAGAACVGSSRAFLLLGFGPGTIWGMMTVMAGNLPRDITERAVLRIDNFRLSSSSSRSPSHTTPPFPFDECFGEK